MNVFTLSTLMVVSFVVCAVTFTSMGILFWTSLAVFAYTCCEANKNYERYKSELDEHYGRDQKFH